MSDVKWSNFLFSLSTSFYSSTKCWHGRLGLIASISNRTSLCYRRKPMSLETIETWPSTTGDTTNQTATNLDLDKSWHLLDVFSFSPLCLICPLIGSISTRTIRWTIRWIIRHIRQLVRHRKCLANWLLKVWGRRVPDICREDVNINT